MLMLMMGKIKFMGKEANLGCITNAHSFALVSSASGAEQKTHPQVSVPKGASCILDFAYSPSEENVILVTDQGTLIIANVLQMGGVEGGDSSSNNSNTIFLALVKEIGLWANIKGRVSFA